MKMRPDGLSEADHRSLLAIERAAKNILEQCAFLRKNASQGDDDRLRFLLTESYVIQALNITRRAKNRYYKLRGWK